MQASSNKHGQLLDPFSQNDQNMYLPKEALTGHLGVDIASRVHLRLDLVTQLCESPFWFFNSMVNLSMPIQAM